MRPRAGELLVSPVRGVGCGRIPLFIDTDCVLPFDFAIDWKRFRVWVDQVDLRSVADSGGRVPRLHLGEEFEELQVACRRLWEEWLSLRRSSPTSTVTWT